jgi:MoxR-like ATPase
MKRIDIARPTREQRREVIDLEADGRLDINRVSTREELLAVRKEIRKVNLDSVARDYIADLVEATITDRTHVDLVKTTVDEGASERATVALVRAARAHAYLQGRDYVLTQDIDAVATPILRHRLPLVSGSETTTDHVVAQILEQIQSRG